VTFPKNTRALGLGIVLCLGFTVVNAYVGLKVGWLVPVSIPATILALALLKGLLRDRDPAASVYVQAVATSGQAVTTALIVIIPALLLAGRWSILPFWPICLLGLAGGLLGVFLLTPSDENLPFPEAKACNDLSHLNHLSVPFLMLGAVVSGALRAMTSFFGSVQSRWETFVLARSFPLYFGIELSLAGVGIGYLLPLEMSLVLGGSSAMAWWIALPLLGVPDQAADLLPHFWKIWSTKIRFLGVGALIPAGVWALLQTREHLAPALLQVKTKWRRRPVDMTVLLGAGFFLLPLVHWLFLHRVVPTIALSAAALLLSGFFAVLASRLTGILGLTFAPVMALAVPACCCLGALLFMMNVPAETAVAATLAATGVLLGASLTAASLAQDTQVAKSGKFSAGDLRIAKIAGVVTASLALPFVFRFLHQARGIGTGQPEAFLAPHANLLSSVLGQSELPWTLILIGAALGTAVHILDQLLVHRGSRVRVPVLAFAIGFYLPFPLALPLLLGGFAKLLTKKQKLATIGTLIASGLILGEAIGSLIEALAHTR